MIRKWLRRWLDVPEQARIEVLERRLQDITGETSDFYLHRKMYSIPRPHDGALIVGIEVPK
jgi:hypothetical protein